MSLLPCQEGQTNKAEQSQNCKDNSVLMSHQIQHNNGNSSVALQVIEYLETSQKAMQTWKYGKIQIREEGDLTVDTGNGMNVRTKEKNNMPFIVFLVYQSESLQKMFVHSKEFN